MIRRTIGAVMAAGLLLIPLSATSASAAAPNEDKVKCVLKALVDGTGAYWCFATPPPPP